MIKRTLSALSKNETVCEQDQKDSAKTSGQNIQINESSFNLCSDCFYAKCFLKTVNFLTILNLKIRNGQHEKSKNDWRNSGGTLRQKSNLIYF